MTPDELNAAIRRMLTTELERSRARLEAWQARAEATGPGAGWHRVAAVERKHADQTAHLLRWHADELARIDQRERERLASQFRAAIEGVDLTDPQRAHLEQAIGTADLEPSEESSEGLGTR